MRIDTDVPAQAVGFDARQSDRVVPKTSQLHVATFEPNGRDRSGMRLINLDKDFPTPLQFLTHPDGTRMIVRFADRLCYIAPKDDPRVPIVKAPFIMNFMLLVPLAS